MADPNPDIVVRKAVVGYSTSSTVSRSPFLAAELELWLVLGSENSSVGRVYSDVLISFEDDDEDHLGTCDTRGDELGISQIILPPQEFDNYMSILRYANPAVLELFLHPTPKGIGFYEIIGVRLTGGWGVATPVPSDQRPSPLRRSATRRSTASQG